MPEREFHDAANIFPLMTNDEFLELCDDIRKHGQQLPIVLIDEKILDGRNRYRACIHLGIEPEFVGYTGSDPISYAISANLKRRNLTVGQRAMVAEKTLPLFKREAERCRAATWSKPGEQAHKRAKTLSSGVSINKSSPQKGKSSTAAAKLTGVSQSSVEKAQKVRKTASPEVIAAVESGEMSLNEAVEEAQDNGKPKPERTPQELLKELDSLIGRAVRIVNRIGTDDAKGEKVSKLLGKVLELSASWKSPGDPPVKKKVSTALSADDVSEVVEHYRTFHSKARPGEKEKGKIRARMKDGYSVDDLKAAIDGCRRSPFHCGENDGGKKYQSLELIMRDSSKVNQFLEVPINGEEPVLSERTRRIMRAGAAFIEQEESRNESI